MPRLGLCLRLALLALLGYCGGVAGKVVVSVPDMVEAKEGGTARIPCKFNITGQSNYTYQHWFYDKGMRTQMSYKGPENQTLMDTEYSERMLVQPDFTLLISGVTVQDERTFICQVGAGVAGVGEDQTELRVYKTPEPPVIKANSIAILVTNDTHEKIADCTSRNGYPIANITWYKGRTPLQPSDKVHITSTLTTESSGLFTVSSTLYSHVQKQDRDALFYCEVNYRMPGTDHMMESEQVNITVYYPTEKVSLSVESPQDPVKEGDTVTLFCEADGNPPPEYSYHRVYESKEGEDEEEDIEGVEREYLVLENVTKADSGRYRCRAFDSNNAEADIKDDLEISVNYLEPIKLSPSSPVEVLLGEEVVVHCSADGSMPRDYHWKKKGKLVMPGPELILSNVTYEMGGRYSCAVLVPDVPGLNGSKGVSITVRGRPQIMVKQSEVQVFEDEMVNLTCEAFGHPTPKITWDAEGSVAHSEKAHHVSSHLSVLVTSELLSSGVTCNASNSLGSSDHNIRLEANVPSVSTGVIIATTTTTTTMVTPTVMKRGDSKGVLIVAIIVCILLLAILGAVLYFLYKKGKIACGRSGKQNITSPDDQKDDIVVEMKTDKLPEEAELLKGSNGEKRHSSDQGEKYIDLRN